MPEPRTGLLLAAGLLGLAWHGRRKWRSRDLSTHNAPTSVGAFSFLGDSWQPIYSAPMRAVALLALGVGLAAVAAAQPRDATPAPGTAQVLLERAFANLYADDYIQTLRLTTRARGGREMSRQLQITRRQSVRPGKALVRFLAPYDVRHTSILILENDGASDDLFVYLPAVRRTRHLSSSQRRDAFFGTDLCYEDVEPKQAADYRASWLGMEMRDDAPVCARLEIRARPPFESTYERMISCIEPERAVIHWTEFYREGQVVKRLETDLSQVRSIGDRFIPFRMAIATPRIRSETRVDTERYDLRPAIPDALFTTWNLEAGDARGDRAKSADLEGTHP